MNKPDDADVYDWDKFVEWWEGKGVEHEEDWGRCWRYWKARYNKGAESPTPLVFSNQGDLA